MTIKGFLIFINLCIAWINLSSQIYSTSNPISLSLSSCDVTLTNAWSSMGNPAGNAELKNSLLSAFYENRFYMSELATRGVSIVIPTKYGTFNGMPTQFGFNDYNITTVSAGYSRLFGRYLSAGFQLHYWNIFINGAGHFTNVVASIGAIYKVHSTIKMGVHIYNPEQTSIHYPDYDYEIPSRFSTGLSWNVINQSYWYFEIEKDFKDNPIIASAIESKIADIFNVRFGYMFTENQLSGGLGVTHKNLTMDLGFAYRHPLGLISAISFTYQPTKNKK